MPPSAVLKVSTEGPSFPPRTMAASASETPFWDFLRWQPDTGRALP